VESESDRHGGENRYRTIAVKRENVNLEPENRRDGHGIDARNRPGAPTVGTMIGMMRRMGSSLSGATATLVGEAIAMRRRRDRRKADPSHRTAREREEFRTEARFVDVLRRFQLVAAGVMLVGLTVSTLVCAGEFKLPWLVGAGGVVVLLGLGLFAVARPMTRWWTREK
jgi:hypothetical protein